MSKTKSCEKGFISLKLTNVVHNIFNNTSYEKFLKSIGSREFLTFNFHKLNTIIFKI